jgi:hypothetical protein
MFIPDPDLDFLPIPDSGSATRKTTRKHAGNIFLYFLFFFAILKMLKKGGYSMAGMLWQTRGIGTSTYVVFNFSWY